MLFSLILHWYYFMTMPQHIVVGIQKIKKVFIGITSRVYSTHSTQMFSKITVSLTAFKIICTFPLTQKKYLKFNI